jgi:predicted ester cyclase
MGKLTEIMDEAWKITEAQEWDRLGEVMHPTTEFVMPGASLRGPEEFKALCQSWWSAFPDLKHTVMAEIETGDTYACELRMKGTHTGTMRTPGGDIPATGKRIDMGSADYVRFKDGKIASWHAYPDMMGLMAQLGQGR